MPAGYVHEFIAKRALQKSGFETIYAKNIATYLLGAQGPDILFYYGIFPFKTDHNPNKLGRIMHKENIFEFIENLSENSKNGSKAEQSFVMGWACHIISDNIIHPYINSIAVRNGRYRSARHLNLEAMIDTYTAGNFLPDSRRYLPPSQFWYISEIQENDLKGIARIIKETICATYAKNHRISEKQIYNCILACKRIRKLLYSKKGGKRRMFKILENIIFKPGLITANILPTRLPRTDFLNLNKNEWKDPYDDSTPFSNLSVPELIEEAITVSCEELIKINHLFAEDAEISLNHPCYLPEDNRYFLCTRKP